MNSCLCKHRTLDRLLPGRHEMRAATSVPERAIGMRFRPSHPESSVERAAVCARVLRPAHRSLPNEKRQRVHSSTDGAVVELLNSVVHRKFDSEDASLGPARELDDKLIFAGCELGSSTPLRVALLLSGGVDSSLALHLVKRAGHHVTAFYLQIWFQEDFRNFWGACPWEEDLDYCRKVCEAENVPLRVVPFTEEYWDAVVSDSIEEIKQGRTPNPDMLCNSRVKFGAFYQYLEREHSKLFDRVATGHYARLIRPRGKGMVQLGLTPDAIKDQTYFLAHLTQEQLARAMFPLGALTKAEVRQLAATARLPTQSRRDSQGICFLGKVRFEEFVREQLGRWPGPLVEEESGRVLGFHDAYWFYTPGQRKGILLSGGPWYVSRKDCRRNVVYISRQYYVPDKRRRSFRCGKFNWLSGAAPNAREMQCKTRHGPRMYGCSLLMEAAGCSAVVRLDDDDQGLAAGQYAVFYHEGVCLGTGVIFEALQLPVAEPVHEVVPQ